MASTKAFCIPARVAALADLTEHDAARAYLGSVHIEPPSETGPFAGKAVAVATNGYMLARVAFPAIPATDFPIVPGFAPNGAETVNVPADALKRICKSVPKKSRLPILDHVAVTTSNDNGKVKVTMAATDLEAPTTLAVESIEGRFPSWESVVPQGAPLAEFTFNPAALMRLLKVMVAATDGSANERHYNFKPVTMRVYADGVAAVVECEDALGILCPCTKGGSRG